MIVIKQAAANRCHQDKVRYLHIKYASMTENNNKLNYNTLNII